MNDSEILAHVTYSLNNAPIRPFPFPHFYATNCFPDYYYWNELIPSVTQSPFMGSKFRSRAFGDPSSIPGLGPLATDGFMRHVVSCFNPWIRKRYSGGQPFGGHEVEVFTDLRLVRDTVGYAIGPHTDAPWKLISLLFYLSDDHFTDTPGTTLYTSERVCPGGPHYDLSEDFTPCYTAPFAPNTCLGFWKTNQSWHGVPRIDHLDKPRNVLLYNVYDTEVDRRYHGGKDPTPATVEPPYKIPNKATGDTP